MSKLDSQFMNRLLSLLFLDRDWKVKRADSADPSGFPASPDPATTR